MSINDQDILKLSKSFSKQSEVSAEDENNSQNEEAEKVEESLRDFIGKIIVYYEKFNIDNTLLVKYEKKISNAETLLEVFGVMKEMFDELMKHVVKNKNDSFDCSEISNNNNQENKNEAIEKILHKYELEIRAHIKMEKEFKKIAEETEDKYKILHEKYLNLQEQLNKNNIKLDKNTKEKENLFRENKKIKQILQEFSEIKNTKKNLHSNSFEKKILPAHFLSNYNGPLQKKKVFLKEHFSKFLNFHG
jgi:hypothetical protein